jgi:hypothetical protein
MFSIPGSNFCTMRVLYELFKAGLTFTNSLRSMRDIVGESKFDFFIEFENARKKVKRTILHSKILSKVFIYYYTHNLIIIGTHTYTFINVHCTEEEYDCHHHVHHTDDDILIRVLLLSWWGCLVYQREYRIQK